MPDRIPLWAVFVATVFIVLLSVEGGFRLGEYRRRHGQREKESPVGAMVGATLGLLAFMLAFTFGLAASRYDVNRNLVLEEANAIGTTYLRAGMLPEPQRTEARTLLRQYVDVRLSRPPGENFEQAIARSEELQSQLWSQAEAAARKAASPVVALFISSLNEVIDLQSKRVIAGMWSRIPSHIWAVLYLVTITAMASVGYYMGLTGARRSLATAALVLAFSVVMLLNADLERPYAGLVTVNRQALFELHRMMAEQASSPSSSLAPIADEVALLAPPTTSPLYTHTLEGR